MKKLLILALLVVGCADMFYTTADQVVDLKLGLVGKHKSVILEELGAYTRKIEDGKGGEILIWEKDHNGRVISQAPIFFLSVARNKK